MNKVFLIGNLTKDPEAFSTASGKPMARMSIAINRKDDADFFDIAVFDSTAELVLQWLGKGRKVAVTGYLKTHKYEKEGVKFVQTQIVATEVEFLDKGEAKPPKHEKPKVEQVTIAELPF